jgi:large subunit ribosomal protein L15
LASGELKEKLNFEVAGASKAAQEAIEKLGGTVSILKRAIPAAEAAAPEVGDDA